MIEDEVQWNWAWEHRSIVRRFIVAGRKMINEKKKKQSFVSAHNNVHIQIIPTKSWSPTAGYI